MNSLKVLIVCLSVIAIILQQSEARFANEVQRGATRDFPGKIRFYHFFLESQQ